MQAIRVHEAGGPEAMVIEELPTPTPGPGQLLVEVEAAGVNFIDVYMRTGAYPSPVPGALGMEGAGRIAACGPPAEGAEDDENGPEFAPGTRVAWTGVAGSYASHVLVPAARAVPVPAGVTTAQAAAVMLQGMTAHYLTHSTYPLEAGDTCLVHAAAGGVGLLLCQMASRRGARILGTVSTEKKAAAARALGANELILYSERDFALEVRRLTDGAGVEVVYDSVGEATFERSLSCLKPRGMMVLYGQSSGRVPPLDAQILNRMGSLFLTRPSLFHHVATRAELLARAGAVLGWVERGELALTIDRTLPLADASEAHRLLQGRQTSGKLLLLPEGGSSQGVPEST